MWITVTTLFCAIHIFMQQCWGIKFIDLPGFGAEEKQQNPLDFLQKSGSVTVKEVAPDQVIVVKKPGPSTFEALRRRLTYESEVKVPKETEHNENLSEKVKYEKYSRLIIDSVTPGRRSMTGKQNSQTKKYGLGVRRQEGEPQDLDDNLKKKIATLVEQTMHDTDVKVKKIMQAKEKHKEKPAYKVGFILSMVKKTRDVMNELFNVAVRHRDDWKALEQLKVFELIVHTNVDTTNLVRQLVEVHIQTLNTSNTNDKAIESIARAGKRRVVVLK